MPGPTREGLRAELVERIKDLEQAVEDGRADLDSQSRAGLQGEPCYRHDGEAFEEISEALRHAEDALQDLDAGGDPELIAEGLD